MWETVCKLLSTINVIIIKNKGNTDIGFNSEIENLISVYQYRNNIFESMSRKQYQCNKGKSHN